MRKDYYPDNDNNSVSSNDIYNDDNNSGGVNNLNVEGLDDFNHDMMDIDFLELFNYYLLHWKILLLALIIGAGLGFGYQYYFLETTYRADATIFIMDNSTSIDVVDLSISNQLGVDYQKILKSRGTLKAVIADTGLDTSYAALSNLIDVTLEEKSHIITITVTTTDKDVSKAIADSLIRVGSRRIQEITTTGDPAVVDYATSDSIRTIKPDLKKCIAYGGLIGLLIPLLILLIQFMMDTTFKTEDDILQKLKRPVLAGVPYYGKKNLVTTKLNYYEKEAFNTLYGNISLSGVDNRAIAITSSNANEGKSSLSFKLAEIITDYGKRVCYVDCDMRNSDFCNLYGIDKDINPGLSGFLSGNATIDQVAIRDENDKNLFIIPPGKNPPNPSALLSGERFGTLVKVLREKFDYVILDTPPVNAVIDGIFISKQCDGTVMVIESGETDSRQAVRALNDLTMANVNVLGIVVNKIGRKKGYGYGYGYGYGRRRKYGYGYGYGKNGYGKGYGKGYGYGYGYGKGYGYGYGHVETGERAEDIKPKDKKSEDKMPKDIQPENKKPEDIQPEEQKPEDIQPEEQKPEGVEPVVSEDTETKTEV